MKKFNDVFYAMNFVGEKASLQPQSYIRLLFKK